MLFERFDALFLWVLLKRQQKDYSVCEDDDLPGLRFLNKLSRVSRWLAGIIPQSSPGDHFKSLSALNSQSPCCVNIDSISAILS
jgi:hypothetical protein